MYHTTLSSQYTRVAFVMCLLLGFVFASGTNEPETASRLKARDNMQDIEKALRYDHGFDYKEGECWSLITIPMNEPSRDHVLSQ